MADETQQPAPVDQEAPKGGGKGKTVTVIIIVIVVIVLLGVGGYFLRNYFAEETAEKILESGTGVDVEIDGDTTTLSDEDGTLEHTETSTWPSDAPSDIPKYTDGKIESVVTNTDNELGTAWYVTVEGTDDIAVGKYSEDLISAGYASSSSTSADDFLMVSHDNGTNSITLSFTPSDETLVIMISENYQGS